MSTKLLFVQRESSLLNAKLLTLKIFSFVPQVQMLVAKCHTYSNIRHPAA